MRPFRKILVNINAVAGEHPALEQALELAKSPQAHVTVVDVLPGVPDRARRFVTDEVEQELVDHRWDLLHTIAAARGAGVGTTLLRGTPAIALIREVQLGGYDLLVRSHGSSIGNSKPFGAVDMQLLRKCPCPVWLIGPDAGPRPRRILAAIDAGCESETEAALNRTILDLAFTIRDATHAHLTILYAWSVFGYEFLQRRMSAAEVAATVEAARITAGKNLEKFVTPERDRLAQAETLLMEGEPHDVLPAYAESHHIDLVVMGTVARTGLAGFVMGNTAERILSRLRGSVLAIKPGGFVSPVTLD